MTDFGNMFASKFDKIIHDRLGDTIAVSHPILGDTTMQVHFLKISKEDRKGLNMRVDDYHPVMEIMNEYFPWFVDRVCTITYNGESYFVKDDNPIDKLRHAIHLKDAR